MQMMAKVAEHVGMNYSETPDSRYVDQPLDDFLFPWEEGSVNHPITIQENEGFLSQELQSANHQDNHR